MKKLYKTLLLTGVIFMSTTTFGQYLPSSYEGFFNEIVENFNEIRGTNSVKDGKTSLRLLSPEKIIIRIDHKGSIKTLTFVKEPDEEGEKFWISDNKLTTDMVNKYESKLTKIIKSLVEITQEKAKL